MADTAPKELPVPSSYSSVAALAASRTEMSYTVAHAYQQIRGDLTNGSHHAPDFAHAARRHRLLDRIQRAAPSWADASGYSPSSRLRAQGLAAPARARAGGGGGNRGA